MRTCGWQEPGLAVAYLAPHGEGGNSGAKVFHAGKIQCRGQLLSKSAASLHSLDTGLMRSRVSNVRLVGWM